MRLPGVSVKVSLFSQSYADNAAISSAIVKAIAVSIFLFMATRNGHARPVDVTVILQLRAKYADVR